MCSKRGNCIRGLSELLFACAFIDLCLLSVNVRKSSRVLYRHGAQKKSLRGNFADTYSTVVI